MRVLLIHIKVVLRRKNTQKLSILTCAGSNKPSSPVEGLVPSPFTLRRRLPILSPELVMASTGLIRAGLERKMPYHVEQRGKGIQKMKFQM